MSFFSSAVFWGVIIILIGLSILLKEVFHVHIPLIRIVFGLLLVYWGVRMLAGSSWRNSGKDAVFGEGNASYDDTKSEYNIIFGNGTIDLFKMEMPQQNKKVEVNVVFGNGRLILNDSIPMKIEMNSVFGATVIPDKRMNALGKSYETTHAFRDGSPYILLETNVVFGRLEIQSKNW